MALINNLGIVHGRLFPYFHTYIFLVFLYFYYLNHFLYAPTPTPLSYFLGTFLFTLF